jgi:O-antigen ligase
MISSLKLKKIRLTWENFLLMTFLAGLFFNLISISLTQIFYGLNVATWLFLVWRRQHRFEVPSFFWPLAVYSGLSLISSSLSVNPALSWRDSRELLIYLLIPATMATFTSALRVRLASSILLASGLVNFIYSIIAYIVSGHRGLRLRGFMGHYMTEAGLLMLLIIFCLAQFLFRSEKIRWLWLTLGAASGCLLLLTLTRNAWLGLAASLLLLLALSKPRALLIFPFLLAGIYLLSPIEVKRRVINTFNLSSPSNRQRIEYYRAGLKIIADYPFFGCGPDTVDMVFQHPKYGLSEQAKHNVHLHNNLLQIAAERGLPALLAWLIFMIWTFWLLSRKWRRKPSGGLPWIASGLACVLALFIAGLFEYNFGDSEVVMLYLVLITLPFAPGLKGKKDIP